MITYLLTLHCDRETLDEERGRGGDGSLSFRHRAGAIIILSHPRGLPANILALMEWLLLQVDDEGFHLVDTKTTAKPKWGPGMLS